MPDNTTTVGPDGSDNILLINNPSVMNTALNIAERTIVERKCDVKHAAAALGRVKRAITSIMPTRLINSTIVNAVRISKPR